MDIKSVLDERVIDLNMTAKNKKEAIEHLAGKLKDAGYIADVDSYIEDIFPGNSAVEVRIKLDIDSDSDNGYKWSNPKGEKLSVGYGTQCRIIVVTDEYHPLELLLR